jgi:hypothetical protein
MKTVVIETEYSALNIKKPGCVIFPCPKHYEKEFEEYSRSTSGVIIVEFGNKTVCSAKFTFSSLGIDGTIEMITGDYNDCSHILKTAIVSYVITKIREE